MDEKIVKDKGLAKDLANDCISRQAAIRWVKAECNPYGKPTLDYESGKRVMKHLEQMPSAQPECAKDFVMLKVIDLNGRPYYSIIYLENGNEFEGYSSYDLKVISEYLKRYFGFAQPEDIQKIQELEQAQFDKIRELAYQDGKADAMRWISCSERLPEEDTEVLISYRYKEGEGDTDHVDIDITSYGTVCFGGREIHTLKEWRQPFDYFHANYEVIAWMPLPEPYKEEKHD